MPVLNASFGPQRIRYFGLSAVLCVVTACTGPRVVSRFDTRSTTIELQELPGNKGYSLQVEKASVPLPSYRTINVDGAWQIQNHSLILIRGSTVECPLSYLLVSASGGQASTTRLGACGTPYTFELSDNRLVARSGSGRNPVTWIFQNGSLTGPFSATPSSPKRRPSLRHGAGHGSPALPPVSKPVGDEVIPPTVGGGSLPAGAGPKVNVFSAAE
jgi:hypothetical protein